MISDPVDILNQYNISPEYGFLPSKPPLRRLSHSYYEPWESIMDRLPEEIKTSQIRQIVDRMPILDISRLSSESEWRRAYVILAFIAHAYIWCGPNPSQTMPSSITRPFLEVAEHFDLPTTATYSAFNLWNWTQISTDADLTIPENIRMLHTFTGTFDEEWFYIISISIEAEGAKIIPTMLECFEAIQRDHHSKVAELLRKIAACIDRLGQILDKMHAKCDPDVFYHNIRPFLAGSKGMANVGLPNGVFYDEGSGQGRWRQYSGGSNAQSSLIQLLDIMLGVIHNSADRNPEPLQDHKPSVPSEAKPVYIEEMRRYMPLTHRKFLKHVTNAANIRAYSTASDTDMFVRAAYVMAVENLTLFRDKHIAIVARYIILPSRRGNMERRGKELDRERCINIATVSTMERDADIDHEHSSSAAKLCGTGGTHLMPFLKQTRDETLRAIHVD